jgi:hypothetical protein
MPIEPPVQAFARLSRDLMHARRELDEIDDYRLFLQRLTVNPFSNEKGYEDIADRIIKGLCRMNLDIVGDVIKRDALDSESFRYCVTALGRSDRYRDAERWFDKIEKIMKTHADARYKKCARIMRELRGMTAD